MLPEKKVSFVPDADLDCVVDDALACDENPHGDALDVEKVGDGEEGAEG